MRELYAIGDLEFDTGLAFFVAPLSALLGDVLERLKVTDFFSVEEADATTYSLVLAVKESLFLELPGLDGFGLGVIRDSQDEWPLIYCEVTTGPSAQMLSIQHFPLRVEIANPLLRPVAVEGQAGVLEGFSFEIEGGFRVSTDLTVSAALESFSVPPFEIVGTGLVLALQDCRLIVRPEDVDGAITGLGFNSNFRGLYAAAALFDWDLPLQLDDQGLPGIHAQLEDIALGSQGVSLDARLSWPVVYHGGQFDAAQTELLGWCIDPDWRFALAALQVRVQANVPTAVAATGYVRIPLFDAIFALELFVAYGGEGAYGLQGTLRSGDGETVTLPLGRAEYQLTLHDLRVSGDLDAGGAFAFSGQTGLNLMLPGVTFAAAAAGLSVAYTEAGEDLRFTLEQVVIDTVGELAQAELHLVTRRAEGGGTQLELFELSAELAWSDLAGRVLLASVPPGFPLPPDDAQVTLHVRWNEGQLQLSIEAGLEDVDLLWRFLPVEQRPRVASAAVTIALTVAGTEFDGEAGLKLRLQLPDIAALPGVASAGLEQLVRIDTGDPDGWLDAEFRAQIASDGDGSSGALSASLANPVSLAFNLPGLTLPEPPLVVHISAVALELAGDPDQAEGEFRLAGDFLLRPILPSDLGGLVPSAMAVHLERLFAVAHLYDLAGTAELRLGSAAAGAYLVVECRFVEAGLELDLFDMLAGVAANIPGAGAAGSEIDLDIEISFALKRLALTVGHVPDAGMDGGEGVPFRFAVGCELGFAGQFTELAFELSSESLSFGIVELAVPIALPQLPLSRADLDALRDGGGRWDLALWQGGIEPQIDAGLADDQAALVAARTLLEQLEQAGTGDAQHERELFELRYRTIPALQKAIFHATGKKFLTEAVLAVYQLLGQLSGPASQASYQAMVEVYQDAVDLTLGALHFDTQLQFVISDARFLLPFNDPSNIRVEGGAGLRGFAPDDPLAPLADLEFRLGLSADAIYFAVEGGAEPIPLPDFGRYPGSGIVFDRLVIGYGYSKNSLKVDLAGELRLSPQLIEDADTSRQLGVGVRLARNNRLQFKIDLIPVVLGEVDFLLPLVAFDVDLRSDNPPPPPSAETCAPAWDGLQLVAPGVLRADLKRAKFAPFFGPLPAPNYLYAFDLQLGNDDLGLTHVCDDYQVITPVLGTVPIPFLADTTPYFDRLCTRLRLAGFGIDFDLRRPFPHPNPLMVFELMGFLADPTLPIDPAGHLADLMWAEMRNARITLPPAVLGMFPEQGRAITRELDLRINVGTVIALAQQLVGAVGHLQQALAQTGGDIAQVIDRLTRDPPPLQLEGLLDSLPRELRRIELRGSFVGFDATAVFLLLTPETLRRQLEELPGAPATPAPEAGLRWVNVVHDRFTRNPLQGWRAVNHGLKRGVGAWTISQGALVQANNVGDNSAGRYGAMLIRETEPLSDVRIAVDMHSTDNDGMGVVFCVQGDTTFYRFRMTAEQRVWQLMRLKRGVTRVLHETATAFVPGKDYRVRVEVRSVPQAAASLPGALDSRGIRVDPAELALDRRALQRFTTHIRIWVNESLWCDLADADRPLTEGRVGLDSWWNKGARFDDFRIDRAQRDPFALGHAATLEMTRDLQPLNTRAAAPAAPPGQAAAWTTQDLAEFNDADLLQALTGSAAAAVVVAARVRVIASQTYRFVGVLQADGRFRLLTTAGVDPLRLSVAGLEAELPLEVHGRLLLEGRSAGADSWARVEAQLSGDWNLLPTPGGSLARLVIGSVTQPAQLSLGSRGDFGLRGDATLHLFDDALTVAGAIDASERHVFVSGHLAFAPTLYVASNTKLLELALDVRGRLGPGRQFLLAGGGDLRLLGKTFSQVSGELSPRGVMLEARLDPDGTAWDINGFALANAQMALRGRVGFAAALPAVVFEGAARLEIADVRIDGQCRIASAAPDWCLAASGNVHWQGRDWLQGAVELCNDGLKVQGQTGFALNLTPEQLPAGIQLASLFLTATVGGSFSVRASGRLKACRFHLDWTLAVQLPGAQAQQVLPIAAQRISVERPAIASKAAVKLADLIDIDGLDLLPLDGVSVPLPVLAETGGTPLYLHTGVSLDPPAVSLPFSVIASTPPADDPDADPWITIPIIDVNLYRRTATVDPPAFDLPIPVLSDQPPGGVANPQPLVRVPEIALGEVDLGGAIRLDQLKLGLALWWKDGALGIKVTNTGKFFAFDALPPVQLLPGSLLSGLADLDLRRG